LADPFLRLLNSIRGAFLASFPMKVKILGFEWRVPKATTPDAFCRFLHGATGQSFGEFTAAFVPAQNGYWAGLVLTDKQLKCFAKKVTVRGNFTVEPHELDLGENVVDFNFFLWYPPTGRGLYQYYHNSLRITGFGAFIRQRMEEHKAALLAALPEGAAKEKMRALCEASLGFNALVRQESFDQLVAELRRVKSLECEFATIHAVEEEFRPLANTAKRVSHRFVFHRKKQIDEAKAEVRAFFAKAFSFKRASIVGEDSNGAEAVYKLKEEPDCFSEADHTDWTRTVRINGEDLAGTVRESEIIGSLLKLTQIDRIRETLTRPARDE